MEHFELFFESLLSKHDLRLSARQREQFDQYFHMLIEWNEKINLTAITEREQVYVKHFFDSLSVSFFTPFSDVSSVADIGSGAGFPSIPLKIMFPHLRVTLFDALNKRIIFLNTLIEKLELEHVSCIHSRAEDAARKETFRDQFDIVTARAVARLHVLNELCLPFVKPGGLFVAMKGAQALDELKEASRSFRELRGEMEGAHRFMLPGDDALRHVICIRKKDKTPRKYPRKAGTPSKQPIQ